METVTIDVDRLNLEKHMYLKSVLDLPDYYGCNLDALYDCLSEKRDLNIVLDKYNFADDFSSRCIYVMEEVMSKYHHITLVYRNGKEETDYDL